MQTDHDDAVDTFFDATRRDFTGWGIASLCASALLLLVYSCRPDVRRTPGWLFLYSSVCEFFVAAGFVVLSLVVDPDADDQSVEHLVCVHYPHMLVGVLAFDMAANSWRLFMYIDLIVVYHNPFRPNTLRPLYHAFVAMTAILWAASILRTDVLCSSSDPEGGSLNLQTLTWGLVYAPFLMFVVIGSSLYVAVTALLSRDKTSTAVMGLARQRVMRHCLLYLVLFVFLFGLLAASYANIQFVQLMPRHSPFAVHLAAALTAGRPAFSFVGWLLINLAPPSLSNCCKRSSLLGGRPLSDAATPLRHPLLHRSRTVPAGPADPDEAWDVRRRPRAHATGEAPTPRSTDGSNAPDGWFAESQGVREAGFKEELRYEVVLDVTNGISELAEREVREHSLSMSGLPSQSSMCADFESLHSPPKSFATQLRVRESFLAQLPRVQHYAVAHFRIIRSAFGLSAQEFAEVFRSSLPELQHQQSRRLREAVSEGRSGAFFYWVKRPDGTDSGYIVKQISRQEKNSLMSILPAYKEHVQARFGRTLIQYLSCHSMRLRWQWAGKVYFVVMRNFFPISPQLSFDLKGATANRRALKTWHLHQSDSVASKYSTLRDWEWMDIAMTTDMADEDAARLWAMIVADTQLLEHQQLIDYSLLLGIYRPNATLIPQHKKKELQMLAEKCCGTAFVSRDRQKIYFFGIIDVLEKYSMRWRLQRMLLRTLYGVAMRWTSSDGISAMPPALYADRFRTFVAKEVLHLDDKALTQPLAEDYWRDGGRRSSLKERARASNAACVARLGGLARWQRLWERRRRGLVKQRIDSEHDDYIARIQELEQHVKDLERRVEELVGAPEELVETETQR